MNEKLKSEFKKPGTLGCLGLLFIFLIAWAASSGEPTQEEKDKEIQRTAEACANLRISRLTDVQDLNYSSVDSYPDSESAQSKTEWWVTGSGAFSELSTGIVIDANYTCKVRLDQADPTKGQCLASCVSASDIIKGENVHTFDQWPPLQ